MRSREPLDIAQRYVIPTHVGYSHLHGRKLHGGARDHHIFLLLSVSLIALLLAWGASDAAAYLQKVDAVLQGPRPQLSEIVPDYRPPANEPPGLLVADLTSNQPQGMDWGPDRRSALEAGLSDNLSFSHAMSRRDLC